MMMVATHIKKIKHSMLCAIGVCLRDITNTIFVIVSQRVLVFLLLLFCFKGRENFVVVLLDSNGHI